MKCLFCSSIPRDVPLRSTALSCRQVADSNAPCDDPLRHRWSWLLRPRHLKPRRVQKVQKVQKAPKAFSDASRSVGPPPPFQP